MRDISAASEVQYGTDAFDVDWFGDTRGPTMVRD